MIRKGINQWSFPGGTTIRQCLEQCKKYGYDGFEPAFGLEGELTDQTTDAQIAQVKELSTDVGMPYTSLASGFSWSFNPVSDDPAVRDRAYALLTRQIEVAALLGVSRILFVPGSVGTGFFGKQTVSYDVAYDRTVENLQRIAPHAKACGVIVGVENVWNNFLLSPLEMRALIDAVGSDYVGAYFDVGNVVRTGQPEQWIRILGKRIAAVHFKDFSRSVDTLSGFCDLLEGDTDFPAVMRALREVGYDGYVVAEMGSKSGEHMVQKTALAIDRILAM